MNESRGTTAQRRRADRTFVLFFEDAADGETAPFRGRVEHVRTGASKRFLSVEEFLDFLGTVLDEPDA